MVYGALCMMYQIKPPSDSLNPNLWIRFEIRVEVGVEGGLGFAVYNLWFKVYILGIMV